MPASEERYHAINQSIEKLQQQSLLAQKPVTLVAVSKTQPADAIRTLLMLGHRDFGENRVQEAADKWVKLREQFPDVRLHLIGSLQTNKVKEALRLFDVIHTVDRPSLVDTIIKEQRDSLQAQQFFMQINTGKESQKGGVSPEQAPELLRYCQKAGLVIDGLMCVPPADAVAAPHFALLYKMAQEWKLKNLSMGMSGDYEIAIRMGATHVRIGTALFGEREAAAKR